MFKFCAMKVLLAVLAVMAYPPCASTAEKPPVNSPKLYLTERVFDFGTSLYFKPLSHIFVIKNAGTAPLTVEVGKASCGCTVQTLRDSIVPPGGTTEMEVGYDPKKKEKRPGAYDFFVEIETNDPTESKAVLSVKVRLTNQINVQPGTLDFGTVTSDKVLTQPLHINCYLDGIIPQLTSIKTSSQRLTIGPPEMEELSSSHEYTYEIGLDLRGVVTSFSGILTVETNSRRVPLIEIPVIAQFPSPVTADPSRVLFGVAYPGSTTTKSVSLRATSSDTEVARAECDNDQIHTVLERQTSENKWLLRATLRPTKDPAEPTPLKTVIALFDGKDSKLAEIPVLAIVVPEASRE